MSNPLFVLTIFILFFGTTSISAHKNDACSEDSSPANSVKVEKKKVGIEEISGMWYGIRVGPIFLGHCYSEMILKESSEPQYAGAPDLKVIVSSLQNGVMSSQTAPANYVQTKIQDGVSRPKLTIYGFMGMSELWCQTMETDQGKTWIIWKCSLPMNEESVELWMILSRSTNLDPKVEDDLIGFITKQSQLAIEDLKGISHLNCHGRIEI